MSRHMHFIWRIVIVTGLLVTSGVSYAQEVVNVRYGDHSRFSRVVFDWAETVSYSPRITNGRLEITFDKAGTPNWNGLQNDPLKFMANPEYRLDGDNLIVSFTVPQSAQLKHFLSDTKTVFDVSATEEVRRETPETAVSETTRSDDRLGQSNNQQDLITPTPDVQSTGVKGAVSLSVTRQRDSLRLSYPMQSNSRAAAFIRHNYLWVVFEGTADVNQRSLDPYIGQRVLSARRIDHPTMTVLMYELLPGQNAKMQKIGMDWHVDLKETTAVPALPIPSSHLRIPGFKGENFFYVVENMGDIVVVEDPVIGDEVAIVTTSESSQGVLYKQKFTEFESLATAQGIAVQLNADNLDMTKFRNGISVGSKEGLAISSNQIASRLGITPEYEDSGDDGYGSVETKLVDFANWSQGPLEGDDYIANKHELLYLLANTTNVDRNEVRWRLAKFYLANGRIRESYGVLGVMLEDNAKLIENPEFRTVLGVTNILMHHYEEGAKLLVHKELVAEQDVMMWRAVANNALGNHERAFENYEKGSDTLALHTQENQLRFLFAAIRSGYALGEREFLELALSTLPRYPLNAAQLTEADYWQALLDRDKGDLLKAEESLRGIVKAGVRQTSSWAKLDLINMDIQSKKIDAAEAVDQLEKLRFSWRGDDFELDLLSRLGDMYVDQKDYNTGLQTLRLAVTFFDESQKTADLTRQMTKIYSDLFLKGEADGMDPVKAVALYSEFRELIPLGKDGDNMTRRLADRLVLLDLLPEAADLLKHQIQFRLKGVAQSVVASRLAMIYLLDSRPEEALGMLRATRDAQIPEDIKVRRRMIEARTLIELDRFEEAEILIEKYTTKEADVLRADIFWKSENWDKYIRLGNRQLANRHQDDQALSEEERLAVLRLSVAYAINNDKAGIKTLRDKYKAHMDNGLYGDTFEVITAEKQLTDLNVRRLTKSIASVSKLESFMESYKSEFTNNSSLN